MDEKVKQKEKLAQKLGNRIRARKAKSNQKTETNGIISTTTDDDGDNSVADMLRRRAEDEILREAQRKAELIAEIGPTEVSSKRPHRTNKRFLINTLNSVIHHNKRAAQRRSNHSIRTLEEVIDLTEEDSTATDFENDAKKLKI